MGSRYKFGINPFQDFLFTSILYGANIADKEFEADIYVGFVTILEYFVSDKNDVQFLDFEVEGKDGYFKVVAKNAITALWLSGIFPRNTRQVMDTNEFVMENMKYKFNVKTKKLSYRLMKK